MIDLKWLPLLGTIPLLPDATRRIVQRAKGVHQVSLRSPNLLPNSMAFPVLKNEVPLHFRQRLLVQIPAANSVLVAPRSEIGVSPVLLLIVLLSTYSLAPLNSK